MPRKKSLDLEDITTAARELIARQGLGALSMRNLADELGLGAMSLYRYVDSKQQLVDLMVVDVFDRISLKLPAADAWSEQLTLLMTRTYKAIRRDLDLVPLILTNRHVSERTLRWTETVLGILADGGFVGEERMVALRTLLSYVIGTVQMQSYGPLAGRGTKAMAALPAEEFPLLVETARHARGVSSQREFALGLELVLGGLERRVK